MRYLLLFILLTSSAFADYNPYQVPYYQKVAEGKITGVSITTKFGYNDDVGGSYEDIISSGGSIHYVSTAGTCSVVSDDTQDNSAGTGAYKLIMSGLDAAGAKQQEEILLTGTTPVISSGSWSVVYRAYISEMGAVNTNGLANGTITFTVDGGVCTEIPEDLGQTEMAAYTIAAGTKGYVIGFQISAPKSDDAVVEMLTRPSRTAPWGVKMRVTINQIIYNAVPKVPMGALPAGTDIRWRAVRVGTGDCDVSVQFQVLEIDE